MEYRLSEKQQHRCRTQLEMQEGAGPARLYPSPEIRRTDAMSGTWTQVDTDWGWVEGWFLDSLIGNRPRFEPTRIVVRDPAHSGWAARLLTCPIARRQGWLPGLQHPAAAVQVVFCVAVLLLLAPLLGVWLSGTAAMVIVTVVEALIRTLRGRWLRGVRIDDKECHGWRLLTLSDQLDHAALWAGCLDPTAVAERPSYDQDQDPGGARAYEQYPGTDAQAVKEAES